MDDTNIFILKSSVTWSILNYGFNIKMDERGLFNLYQKEILSHGTKLHIRLKIHDEEYPAVLINVNFDRHKYAEHKDIIQIRYSTTTCKRLQSVFSKSYHFFKERKAVQENKRQHLRLPDSIQEYFVLTMTSQPNVFEMNCFTDKENKLLAQSMSRLTEEEYENNDNDEILADRISNMTDAKARLETRLELVKIRKIDRSIIDNLKFIYDNHCQICGKKIGEEFGKCAIEAHHIDYFTKSQNNDASNIIIISPNYHRIIHLNHPIFNRETKSFEFENGEQLKLTLNKHL